MTSRAQFVTHLLAFGSFARTCKAAPESPFEMDLSTGGGISRPLERQSAGIILVGVNLPAA